MKKALRAKAAPVPSAVNVPTHRRAVSAGYARGEETKVRIIQAALELFGERGYEQTSTRDIAARADVNAPALQYYFDGKDGLYLACAEHMAARGHARWAPALEKVHAILAEKSDTDTLIECVWILVERAADGMLLPRDEIEAWSRFMAWEDLRKKKGPQDAEAVLERCFRGEVKTLLRSLIGRITGRKPDDVQTRIRTVTLMGQVMVFFSMREKVLGEIGWSELDESRVKVIKAVLRDQTVAALKSASRAKR
jgi:TetR/AcrR family transcriptional regulator, regulator of cefoperazone and chloramphenicol sensitivity